MTRSSALTLLALGILASCGISQARAQDPPEPKKVFVCKYVGKPGVDERLQTGQNPISVSVNAIPLGNVQVGSEFADAQGRSVVIAFDTGQPEPGVGSCPPPVPPTTTTAKPTTTTAAPTTTAKPTTTTAKPTTTTAKPTTTTVKPTTTTEKPHQTTTTKPHQTTTTAKSTTTTAKPTTTTAHATTTTRPATTTTRPSTTTTIQGPTTSSAATTTTSTPGQTSTSSSTTSSTSSSSSTSTTFPTPTPFGMNVVPACPDGEPVISITFGNRPDLNGQTGILSFSTGAPSVPLVFQSNQVLLVPWPEGDGDIALLTYTLGAETETAGPLLFPEDCEAVTTTTGVTTSSTSSTTTTTTPTTTTSGPSTSTSSTTTTTAPTTTTTLPGTFAFGGATTVCRSEVPTIVIDFALPGFPSLAGQTGTLTMSDINGNVVSAQPLVYTPGGHVELLYPGTTVNPDGTIDDVPGWILTDDGLWIRDPSDEFLREGILLTYTVNPTATAFITYPPESSACANPDGPFPPGPTPPRGGLPPAGNEPMIAAIAALVLAAGTTLFAVSRRRPS